MQHQIKIYKYWRALTRITYTGARSSARLNGSSKLPAIYAGYTPDVFYLRFEIAPAVTYPILIRKYAKDAHRGKFSEDSERIIRTRATSILDKTSLYRYIG